MAGVINKVERQIDVRAVVPVKGGGKRILTATLNPGFNVVDDALWEECCKNKVVRMYLAGGALVAGKRTREDELIDEKVKQELNADLHNIERTARVASAIPGDAHVVDQEAVARGAGVDGTDVTESGGGLNEDLLG